MSTGALPSATSSTDELGGMHLFDSLPSLPSLPVVERPPSLPMPDLDFSHFAHVKNYLPSPSAVEKYVDQSATPLPPPSGHGVKHKHESPLTVPDGEEAGNFAALSPIKGDEEHNDKRQRRVPWTHTEDVTILALHRHYGTQWDVIAAQLPGRTADAVRNRCFRLQKAHPMATTEEGRHALDGFVMATHGVAIGPPESLSPDGSFNNGHADASAPATPTLAAATAPALPSAAQPIKGADHGRHAWSAEEDRVIVEGVARLGCKWREIAKFLKGRTDSSIRNRWMRLQKDNHTERAQEAARALSPGAAAPASPAPPPVPLPAPQTFAAPPLILPAGPAHSANTTMAEDPAAPTPPPMPKRTASEVLLMAAPPPSRAASLGSTPNDPSMPLGHAAPYVTIDLDCFAALAFDDVSASDAVSVLDEASQPISGLDESSTISLPRSELGGERSELEEDSVMAQVKDLAESSEGQRFLAGEYSGDLDKPAAAGARAVAGRSGTEPVPPKLKLASAILATFAAVSIGVLARGKNR